MSSLWELLNRYSTLAFASVMLATAFPGSPDSDMGDRVTRFLFICYGLYSLREWWMTGEKTNTDVATPD